jgi:hypothetical protein
MPIPVAARFNPLNAELNPICQLLALLGAHHIFHIRRIRVKACVCGRTLAEIVGSNPAGGIYVSLL